MTGTASADQQRIARATLTYLAEPADPAVCGLLQVLSPAELWHPSGLAVSPPV